jgi:hypothetical protein
MCDRLMALVDHCSRDGRREQKKSYTKLARHGFPAWGISCVVYNRGMAASLKPGASPVALIAFFAFGAWSLALPQEQTRQEFTKRLVAAAIERTHHPVRYVPDYVRIPYPNGDVPRDTGVCTDEIIRSYRAVGLTCSGKSMKTW